MLLHVGPRAVPVLNLLVFVKVLFGEFPEIGVLAAEQITQRRADGLLLVLACPAQLIEKRLVLGLIPLLRVDVCADLQDKIFVAERLPVASCCHFATALPAFAPNLLASRTTRASLP